MRLISLDFSVCFFTCLYFIFIFVYPSVCLSFCSDLRPRQLWSGLVLKMTESTGSQRDVCGIKILCFILFLHLSPVEVFPSQVNIHELSQGNRWASTPNSTCYSWPRLDFRAASVFFVIGGILPNPLSLKPSCWNWSMHWFCPTWITVTLFSIASARHLMPLKRPVNRLSYHPSWFLYTASPSNSVESNLWSLWSLSELCIVGHHQY